MSRPGPKPDPMRHVLRRLFSDWSERTFSTYYRAHRQLAALEEFGAITHEEHRRLMALSHRPNGSVNVSKFARIAEDRASMWVASLDEQEANR